MRKALTAFVFILAMLLASAGIVYADGSMDNFARSQVYEGQFEDVADTAWYSSFVRDAYEYGFVSGDSETTYSPDDSFCEKDSCFPAAGSPAALRICLRGDSGAEK